MIRDATLEDFEYFYTAARSFLDTTGDGAYLNLNPEGYHRFFANMVEADFCKLVIKRHGGSTVGHCGMLLIPSIFDETQTIGKIFTVWGKGALALVNTCEDYARERGAVLILADSHRKLKQPAVARAYEKKGFELSDQLYMKVL